MSGYDEKANVGLAIIGLADWLGLDDDTHVHVNVMDAMATLQREIMDGDGQATADQSMQLAELTRWLFVQHPLFARADGRLAPYMEEISDTLLRVFAWTVPLAKLERGLTDKDERLVTTVLEALVAIANYRGRDQQYDWSAYATPSTTACATWRQRGVNVGGALSFFIRHGNTAQKKRVCDLIHNSLRMSIQKRDLGFPDAHRKVAFTRQLINHGLLNDLELAGIDDFDMSRRSIKALGAITRQLAQLRTTTPP